jgi:glycosyltransferase involved in cell wall biosynthesis
MNLKDKKKGSVDCICITYNRTEFLPGSIRCFQNQTYPHKHLYIFFTSTDNSTKKFVQKNKQYNSVSLDYKLKRSNEFIFESIVDSNKSYDQFVDNELFYIRTCEGEYLKALGNTSIGLDLFNAEDAALQFELIKNDNDTISIHTNSDQWLKSERDGTLAQAPLCKEWETFKIVSEKENNKISISSWHQFSGEKNLPVKVDDSFFWNATLLRDAHSEITFVEIKEHTTLSLGEKRNLASNYVKGDYIGVWDDDDWHNPSRISNQIEYIVKSGKAACALGSIYLYNTLSNEAYITRRRPEGWEGTLLCEKKCIGRYEHLTGKEDTIVVNKLLHENSIYILDMPYLYIYQIHKNNTSDTSHFNVIMKDSYRVAPNEDQFIKECFTIMF